MKKFTTPILAASLLLSPALFADDAATKEKPAKEEKAEKKADREVKITSNDQMKFDKAEIKVKVGETIKFVHENVGKLPKIAMGHNLIILKKDATLVTFATAAMTAKDNDFIPPKDSKEAKSVLAHTKLLGPGEKDSIVHTFKEAGTYEFLCSFPGHFALMKGKIIVK